VSRVVIRGYRLGPLLSGTAKEIVADGVPTLAAQTAYYFFFSLFPLLLFLAPLLSVIGDERAMMQAIETQLASVVGTQAFIPLKAALESVVFTNGAPGLMSTGLLLTAWSGSNIFGALMGALNTAYGVPDDRPWWKRQAIRLGSFVVAGVIMILATVVMLGGEDVARLVSSRIGLGESGRLAWTILQFPLAILFLVGLAFMLFYFLPNVKQDWRHVLAAAVVTTVLWIVATLLFRLYVQNFASFNKTYGTIGGIIALLSWMYYSMFVVLAGGELAAELQHGTGAMTPQRGAIYNGRVVSGAGPGASSIARAYRANPPGTGDNA